MGGRADLSWGVVVLAAGQGTRMRSRLPKVLHEVGGRPLIDHVLDVSLAFVPAERVVVVLGHGSDQVQRHLGGRGVATVLQEPQLGTGDALRVALENPAGRLGDAVIVLSGDVPLLGVRTVRSLARQVEEEGADAALLTAALDEPGGYGRVVRAADGSVREVVEARDADPATLAVREVNAGVYAFRRRPVSRALAGLSPDNVQGEYYLTDVLGALRRQGLPVAAVTLDDPEEMHGVNTRADLARVARIANRRVLHALQDEGVTVLDPATTWVEAGCTVGQDVVLEPGVVVRRGASIGAEARIGAHSVIDGGIVSAGERVAPLSLRRSENTSGPDGGA